MNHLNKTLLILAMGASALSFARPGGHRPPHRPHPHPRPRPVRPVRPAPAPGVFLGETSLTRNTDFDVIHVGLGCARAFDKVAVRVLRNGAQIDRLRVIYANSSIQELSVRNRFSAGSTSRWLDLSGQDRCIRAIEVVGDTDGFVLGPQALVQVFAL